MSDKNYELELYKLITEKEDECSYVSEMGWVSDTEFCVWVYYHDLLDFMDKAEEIFGYEMFDDGGFNANMQSDCVCIDLCKMLESYLNIEDVFPKEKYQH